MMQAAAGLSRITKHHAMLRQTAQAQPTPNPEPDVPANEMIEIDTHAMIGKGLHRECFVHPEDSNLCVKIVVAGNSDENRREASYYARLERRGVSWEMLPRFHGLVQTNLGEGAIFDLVRDYDGPVSHTLAHYLASKRLTAEHATVLRTALVNLKDYLLQNRIITMTLKPKNILFQQYAAGEGRLVIVDNIGNSDFIPLANHSKWLARRKIQRKWRRFEANLRSAYRSNSNLGQLLNDPVGAAVGRGGS